MVEIVQSRDRRVEDVFTYKHALETVFVLGILGAGGYGLYTVLKKSADEGDKTAVVVESVKPSTPPAATENGGTYLRIAGIAVLVIGAIEALLSFFVKGRIGRAAFAPGILSTLAGAFLVISSVKSGSSFSDVVPVVAMSLSVAGVVALLVGKFMMMRMVGVVGAFLSAGAVLLLSAAVEGMPTKVSYYFLAGLTVLTYILFIRAPMPAAEPVGGSRRSAVMNQLGGPLVFWAALLASAAQVWALVMTGISSPKSGMVYVPLVLTGGVLLLLISLLYRKAGTGAAEDTERERSVEEEDSEATRLEAETLREAGRIRDRSSSGEFNLYGAIRDKRREQKKLSLLDIVTTVVLFGCIIAGASVAANESINTGVRIVVPLALLLFATTFISIFQEKGLGMGTREVEDEDHIA